MHGLRLFTKLLVAHPLVGICLPPEIRPADCLRLTGYMVGSLYIRGHSAGSYAGMVWETILTEFPDIDGKTVLAAIALPLVDVPAQTLVAPLSRHAVAFNSCPAAFSINQKRFTT